MPDSTICVWDAGAIAPASQTLQQRFVENAHDFTGTVGHGQESAPVAHSGKAVALLEPDVVLDFLFGANDLSFLFTLPTPLEEMDDDLSFVNRTVRNLFFQENP